MDLRTYCLSNGGTAKRDCPVLARVAERAKCSPATLYMITLGHKRAGPTLAGAIEYGTDGSVTRGELRADYFGQPSPIADVSDAA